jgi:hypothetical protein
MPKAVKPHAFQPGFAGQQTGGCCCRVRLQIVPVRAGENEVQGSLVGRTK